MQLPHVWVGAHTCDPEQKIDHPYIISDVFRAYANHIIDPVYSSFDPSTVKEGDVVDVYMFYLEFFFSTVHPEIRFPYFKFKKSGSGYRFFGGGRLGDKLLTYAVTKWASWKNGVKIFITWPALIV